VNHEKLAGLQIADAVASGVYCAVNLSQYGEAEPRYLNPHHGFQTGVRKNPIGRAPEYLRICLVSSSRRSAL